MSTFNRNTSGAKAASPAGAAPGCNSHAGRAPAINVDAPSRFTPCKGKTVCRDDGEKCLTCGRSLAEIEQTRNLIDALADFVCTQGYDNAGEFAAYVADKVEKKVWHRRETA